MRTPGTTYASDRPPMPSPVTLLSPRAAETYGVDPVQVADVMGRLGSSPSLIARTTVYLTASRAIGAMSDGFVCPAAVAHRIAGEVPEISQTTGPLVCVPVARYGRLQPPAQLNRRLVSLLTHVQQIDEHDVGATAEVVVKYGVFALGAVAGIQYVHGWRAALFAGRCIRDITTGYVGDIFAEYKHEANTVADVLMTGAVSRRSSAA